MTIVPDHVPTARALERVLEMMTPEQRERWGGAWHGLQPWREASREERRAAWYGASRILEGREPDDGQRGVMR